MMSKSKRIVSWAMRLFPTGDGNGTSGRGAGMFSWPWPMARGKARQGDEAARSFARLHQLGERRELVPFALGGGSNSSRAEPPKVGRMGDARADAYTGMRPNDQRPTMDGKMQPRIGRRKRRSGFAPFARLPGIAGR
ncbi:uncharacterized protein Triagg1_696 [Trichoderma aggressivum f. europaeum]|uniref:Uncharacterized protein n=1 Tax=Trichoderma aggressivum f. europaeum TaxID=173218 RepID=A0AAE1M2Y0_9HYPO|nr:hypothetical protein Triagg1_696 [Trichoderma aggressivum f. europaeum]